MVLPPSGSPSICAPSENEQNYNINETFGKAFLKKTKSKDGYINLKSSMKSEKCERFYNFEDKEDHINEDDLMSPPKVRTPKRTSSIKQPGFFKGSSDHEPLKEVKMDKSVRDIKQ